MFKITAIVSLVLIASWSQADSRRHKKEGSSEDYSSGNLLAAGLSCDSCGSECAAACGTRHFRSCCFNYLRRKRDDTFKLPTHRFLDLKMGRYRKDPQAVVTVDEIPVQWMNDIISNGYRSYYLDDNAEKLDTTYDL